MCQICTDLAEFDAVIDQIVADELPKMLIASEDRAILNGST